MTLWCTSFYLLEVSLGMGVGASVRRVSADSSRGWWVGVGPLSGVYLLIVGGVGAVVHTGLSWRLCGRHKMTVFRLSAADVMWLIGGISQVSVWLP